MRTVRRSLYLLTLLFILLVAGCGTSPSSRVTQSPASSVFRSIPPATEKGNPVRDTETPVPMYKPVRLLIPAIDVDAPVEKVGVLTNGNLAAPGQNPWEGVGWYSSGTYPGEQGSAVLDGHLDRPGGFPAVFWRLRDLHVGDRVMVIDAKGKTLRFHVIRIASYSPEEAPVQAIFADRSGTYLNLITCAGEWIPSQRQTTLRLVVYTVLD